MRAASPRSNATEGNLRNSILDGASHSAMVGLTRNYVAPFALALQATTAQMGLLAGVPNLAMALSQLAAPALVVRGSSRKRLILPAAFFHGVIWLPILLIPYLSSDDQVRIDKLLKDADRRSNDVYEKTLAKAVSTREQAKREAEEA